MNTGKIVAAIQARMNSKRFPGKPLFKIGDRTMLEHIRLRLLKSQFIDAVCVATSVSEQDNELVDYLERKNIPYCRGSEENLVGRMYETAKKFDADTLVRVWGDCPLVDPFVIDEMVTQFDEAGADFATNSMPCTYPFGLNAEIYRTQTLEEITTKGRDPFYHQFPMEYVKRNAHLKWINVTYSEDVSHIHLTVDYPQDVNIVAAILAQTPKQGNIVRLEDILQFYRDNQSLFEENKNLERNIEYKEALEARKTS